MPQRQWPSAYGQMAAARRRLGDLDPNLYRERLEEALRLLEHDGSSALLAHVERQIRRPPSRPTSARPGCGAGAGSESPLLSRLGGALRAAHAGCARLVTAPYPSDPERADAFWIVGGRVVE